MKIKCDYCGNTYEDTMKNCPSCGAPNTSQNKNDKKPRTIEELKDWYKARKLPPYETTRFFIGIDYKQPRAFGIYKDENGDFVVYKNKDTGERAIRYRGKDEAYAVNELYLKLKEEIIHQKSLNSSRRNNDRYYYKRQTNNSGIEIPTSYGKSSFISAKSLLTTIIVVWFIIVISVALIGKNTHTGYYSYNDTVYYMDSHSDWYYYDDYSDTWYNDNKYNPDIVAITKDYDSYYTTDKWDSTQQFSNVKDSWDYKSNQESYQSSSDSDSDYDWSSGDSWDSGGTDWGSDW